VSRPVVKTFRCSADDVNAALIVALRNAAPALLARLRAAEAVAVRAADYRRRQRTGGGCDIETTTRLYECEQEARDALDAALATWEEGRR
jgi:hypothetical protein